MGYTTEFSGILEFDENVMVAEVRMVSEIINLGRNGNHPDYSGYIQLKVNEELTGIEWDGTEKFYDSVEAVNFVIKKVRVNYPDFCLWGELLAQGEDSADRWIMRIGEDGLARKIALRPTGVHCMCPNCGYEFWQDGEWLESES